MSVKLLTIDVSISDPFTVRGHKAHVTMLPFTGTADGDYFTGRTVGPGVDTQTFTVRDDGSEEARLSARYMLEGKDYTGKACRIFIDNSRHDSDGWHPVIVTDSEALAEWENTDLVASVDPIGGGVRVQIFRP